MAQLKMVSDNGTLLGAISWFAIHPTSMNNTNVLVSSDNVGYASVLLEEAINPPGTFPGKVETYLPCVDIIRGLSDVQL